MKCKKEVCSSLKVTWEVKETKNNQVIYLAQEFYTWIGFMYVYSLASKYTDSEKKQLFHFFKYLLNPVILFRYL